MSASAVLPVRPRGRHGWAAGALTAVLLVGGGLVLAAPSTATTLAATTASTFVPADATRGKVTLRVGTSEEPAELSDARLPARAVPGAFSPTAYAAVDPGVRADPDAAWYREAVVPVDPTTPSRWRLRTVDDRGVWLVAQDWGDLGLVFDGLLELPASVSAGQTWTSAGTVRTRPADGVRPFSSTSTASVPADPSRAAAGCLTVEARTTIGDASPQTWTESELWCPGKGVVSGSGSWRGAAYAVTSGGEATPVSDADLAPTTFELQGVEGWRLTERTVLAGDPTFGLTDAASTGLLDPGRTPVVTASGIAVFPTLEGGDLTGLVPDGPDLWADWWARPGGQVTSTATTGALVVAATTAHRVTAYRAGRTLAWNAPLDDVAVAPPLPVGDALAVATVSGSLTLLDARDGATRWTTPVGGGVHGGLAAGDGLVVTADTTSTVTAWDVTTGRPRWSVPDAGSPFGTTLLVTQGRVVVAAGGTVSAYDVADGREAWVHEAGLGLGTLTLAGDELWLGVGDDLQAWSPVDGSRRWTVAGTLPVTSTSCPSTADGPGLARQGDRLVALAADGSVGASWDWPGTAGDDVSATCRGAGVDLVVSAPDGSRPLRVLRLAAP